MKYSDLVPKSRTRKSIQESGSATRGRGASIGISRTHGHDGTVRNHSAEMSKSSSISNINQIRPRSTSLTRSQSQRLGPGRGHHTTVNTGVSSGVGHVTRSTSDRPQPPGANIVRPRSSTLNSNQKSRGKLLNYHKVSSSFHKTMNKNMFMR